MAPHLKRPKAEFDKESKRGKIASRSVCRLKEGATVEGCSWAPSLIPEWLPRGRQGPGLTNSLHTLGDEMRDYLIGLALGAVVAAVVAVCAPEWFDATPLAIIAVALALLAPLTES